MVDAKPKPFYRIVNGILVPGRFREESVLEVMNYKPTSNDVFIVTYPKCGTTWMQIVALYIFRKGQELENYQDFGTVCPFIDATGMKGILNMPRPGAFKTHLPYNLMPFSPEAKYIFVLRNPKDTCVSLFHHTKAAHAIHYSEATFDDFFELFMASEVEYNDYFDHLQSWYPHRNNKGIFNTTFEDMKEDLKSTVLRLAAFLGQEYIGAIERDNGILNNILHFSSFEYMKTHMVGEFPKPPPKIEEMVKIDNVPKPDNRERLRKTHFRKGIVGDWRSHFSEEQSERLDKKFFERFGGTEIYEKYKPFL